MLEARNLLVFFENALALNDLSLEVSAGEVVAVLGSNSAGKTTLMNTISGLLLDIREKEDRRGGERITIMGQVKFEGRDIMELRPSHRVRLGVVLCQERHPIFRDSDVLENLKIAGYLSNRSQMKQSIELVLNIFPALKRLSKRRAGLLSGGEQQMLAIGIALVARPRLLLMDEPLLGLSPLLQADLAQAIKGISDEGITILVTEQFARSIIPIIDRGYVIENGTLVFSGTREEMVENPEVKSAYLGV
jgi:branched-chain amino acid transport system ATP-binding protein